MGFVQKYKTSGANGVITNTRVQLSDPAKSGILLGVHVLWWPLTRDVNGFAIPGKIDFHLEDGPLASSGREILGTDKTNGHRIRVSDVDKIYAWEHNNQDDGVYIAEFLRKFRTQGTESFLGQYVGGFKLIADSLNTSVPHHLMIGLQYIEFD